MDPVDLTSAREFLEAIIAAFSVLGGGMAYSAGTTQHRPWRSSATCSSGPSRQSGPRPRVCDLLASIDAGALRYGYCMKRLVLAPHSAFFAGMIMTVIIAIAVFALGAPPWILVPVTWGGITIYAEMCSRAEGQVGQRRDT